MVIFFTISMKISFWFAVVITFHPNSSAYFFTVSFLKNLKLRFSPRGTSISGRIFPSRIYLTTVSSWALTIWVNPGTETISFACSCQLNRSMVSYPVTCTG